MRADWQTAKLGEACQFINGLWKGEEPPFVRVGVIRNTNFAKDGTLDDSDIAYLDVEAKKFAKRRLQFGDIILEKSGGGPKQPVGRVVLFDKAQGDFSFSNFTSAIRVNEPAILNPMYLHRYLHWIYVSGRTEAMQNHSTGIRNLNGDAYKAITVAFPPIAEQRSIVAMLDEAFEGIAIAKAHAEKNLRNAREVFTGQLERIFSDPTPGWTQVKLEEIGSTQTGSTPRTSEPKNFGSHLPFIKPGDFRRDGTVNYSNEALSKIGASRSRRVAEGSALMVCIGATIGKAGFTEREVATNQQVNSWTPTGSTFGKFIYYQMTSMDFQRRVRDGAGQATLPIINKSKWSALTVVVPAAVEEQRRIVDELDAIQAETIALEELYQRKLAALDEFKQSLLHQAFSGAL